MADPKPFGFKQLTPDNWLEVDGVLKPFVSISANGSVNPISGREWAQRILEPNLDAHVPFEIRRLFEAARGTMLYGYFFYPIYTLAADQLYRVAEAALSSKCAVMGASKRQSFEKKIDWLAGQSVLSEMESTRWHALRQMRNLSSHPEQQFIIMPMNAIESLHNIARQINALFAHE